MNHPSYKLLKFQETYPKIDPSAYIGDGVVIIGDVTIGANSSIWFNSVLRGDIAPIIIGANTNIQDGSVIHTSRFNGPVVIGDNVTVGHMALIHACTLKSNCFVGMRAVVMDHAIVEEYGFIAAGSLITPRKIVGAKELWAGSPGKFVRFLSDEELTQTKDTNENYARLIKIYKAE